MTESIDLDELSRLVDAATPGPWAYGPAQHAESTIELRFDQVGTLELIAGYGWDADAQFIVAARTAVPNLIDRVRELEQQPLPAGVITLDGIEAWMKRYHLGAEFKGIKAAYERGEIR